MKNISGQDSLPKHVAVVMDGNNRWASEKNLPGVSGHQEGVRKARELVELAVEYKLKVLTLFAFSSENWERSEEEVFLLMNLLAEAIENEVPNLIKNAVTIKFIGDLTRFNDDLRSRMKESESRTYTKNKKLDLVVALSYGGRWDIIQAMKELYASVSSADEISDETFSSLLSMGKYPDPDLCIRTGGELRLSNFLLWQTAYSELYFTDTLWPDFSREDFDLALQEFSRRKRNFGKKSNFMNSEKK